jgi:protein-S-isoprenylcysteine O-methyltransferase Ste14
MRICLTILCILSIAAGATAGWQFRHEWPAVLVGLALGAILGALAVVQWAVRRMLRNMELSARRDDPHTTELATFDPLWDG